MKRRDFFTKSTLALGALASGLIPAAQLFAKAALDTGIKKFKYVHELTGELSGTAKRHLKKLLTKVDTFQGVTVNKADLKPVCQYCKWWEEPTDGYAYCKFVAPKKKADKKAYITGWCAMFNPVAKTEQFKKRLTYKA